MELAIEALADEARRVGEAFLTVRASQDLRLGLAARQENGAISLDLEVQVRVLPSRSDVSTAALRARIDDLSELEASGLRSLPLRGRLGAGHPLHLAAGA